MIPLPRPWALSAAMLVGVAAGVLLGVGVPLLVSVRPRPDVVIALVLAVPSAAGLLTIVLSTRRWLTGLGAALLALGVGWFGVLTVVQVASGG
ncbi:hypothetical protein KIH27_04480 [Mycobacterium sp. M1]|uniref:Hydrophobic protein n=1 Tax=Mycolicibacter acidiphilus TaxID=2835306 RepID=A0ABS5REY1_9MYCO|nr:putative holin [Mycolicibacter acidiphilus]MBS9532843.1 hypothetical protein [Mycolicibacter acidiphilus]